MTIKDLGDFEADLEEQLTDEIEKNVSDPKLADFVDWERYAQHVIERDDLHIHRDRTTGEYFLT